MKFFLALWLVVPVVVQAQVTSDIMARVEDPKGVADLEATLKKSLSEKPNDFDTLVLAARFKYWRADGTADANLKRQWAKEGWDFGERMIALQPERIEGHYFSAINIGAYSQAVGVLKALMEGLEGQFNRRLDKALSMSERFDFGGPCIARGRYHFELPWPKRDLRKSREVLERCLRQNPEALRARYYLAETVLAEKDARAARAHLEKVLAGNIDYAPPEGRRMQAWARRLLSTIDGASK